MCAVGMRILANEAVVSRTVFFPPPPPAADAEEEAQGTLDAADAAVHAKPSAAMTQQPQHPEAGQDTHADGDGGDGDGGDGDGGDGDGGDGDGGQGSGSRQSALEALCAAKDEEIAALRRQLESAHVTASGTADAVTSVGNTNA